MWKHLNKARIKFRDNDHFTRECKGATDQHFSIIYILQKIFLINAYANHFICLRRIWNYQQLGDKKITASPNSRLMLILKFAILILVNTSLACDGGFVE